MSIFVYAPVLHKGTRELIETLNAKRLVSFDGMHLRYKGSRLLLDSEDVIICWGSLLPQMQKLKMLNSNKGINTIGPNLASNNAKVIMNIGCTAGVANSIRDWPVPITNNPFETLCKKGPTFHLVSPDFPSYWTQYVHMSDEYEVHYFNGKFLQVYAKVPLYHVASNKTEWEQDKTTQSHYAFKSRLTGWTKQRVALSPVFADYVKTVMGQLKLTFGVIYFGLCPGYKNAIFLRKIDVGPELDEAGVTLYANEILNWIKA